MRTRRSVVDYALARRAAILEVRSGLAPYTDLCDSQPYLLRAAKHFGQPGAQPCPVCHRGDLTHVSYAYGDALGTTNGRARSPADLERLELEHDEFQVYVVEVCQTCSYNHLALTYLLGRAGLPARRRRRTAASD
jgi:hypothetical protein